MENMIGKDFESLAHRIVYSYAGTMPGFVPVKSDVAAEASQKQLYNFICEVAHKLLANPEAIGLTMLPDDFYKDRQLDNRKPKLITTMKAMKKKIDDFYMLLARIGESAEIKDSKFCINKSDIKLNSKIISRMEFFGLNIEVGKDVIIIFHNEHPEMLPAWKLLSSIALENVSGTLDKERQAVVKFSHCMLSPVFPYSKDIFTRLIENQPSFNKLIEFLEKNNYEYLYSRDKVLSMDFVKFYGEAKEPVKDSWAEREHGGISVFYDYKKKNQIFYCLRIPRFKEIISRFDVMEDGLKEFVTRKTKKCNNCGYCTQTDKTGKRKKQLISVTHNGDYDLCLLFPGFNYVWTSLNDEIAENLISFLEFIDRVLQKEEKAV